jgi:prepilin-type N-terminal cleavage/methylation domain-containing protein
MKTNVPFRHTARGFTLLEVTTVIVILLIFMRLGLYSSTKIDQWKLGRNASETLRSVHSAQRMYLADYPTVNVTTLTNAMILPYLPPGNVATMPTVKSLTGANLSITVTVSPPIINNGAGVAYDPSGRTNDSLWDIGE